MIDKKIVDDLEKVVRDFEKNIAHLVDKYELTNEETKFIGSVFRNYFPHLIRETELLGIPIELDAQEVTRKWRKIPGVQSA